MHSKTNRRKFLVASGMTALGASQVMGANDTLRIGLIGTGGRMKTLLYSADKSAPYQLVAACDVYSPNLDKVKERPNNIATTHVDYREVLDIKDLDAVITTDNNYNILTWNEAAERLYGWKREEVLGKLVDDMLHTEYFTSTSSLEASKRLLSRGYWKGKVIQKRKDGTPLTILASVSVIKDDSGNKIGAIAANRDLSELEEE